MFSLSFLFFSFVSFLSLLFLSFPVFLIVCSRPPSTHRQDIEVGVDEVCFLEDDLGFICLVSSMLGEGGGEGG